MKIKSVRCKFGFHCWHPNDKGMWHEDHMVGFHGDGTPRKKGFYECYEEYCCYCRKTKTVKHYEKLLVKG